MNDQTPEDRDRELELRGARDRTAEILAGTHRDLAAILMVRPHLRQSLLSAIEKDGSPSEVTLRILEWVDELLLPREADDLHLALEIQAQVALATAYGADGMG